MAGGSFESHNESRVLLGVCDVQLDLKALKMVKNNQRIAD